MHDSALCAQAGARKAAAAKSGARGAPASAPDTAGAPPDMAASVASEVSHGRHSL